MEIHEMSLQMIKLYYGVVYSYAVNKSIFEEILWVFQKQPKWQLACGSFIGNA